jgi:hypothetical protein
VVKLIQDEVNHLTEAPTNTTSFLAETNWKIEETDTSVALKKTQDQTEVLVEFDLPKEADEEAFQEALAADEEIPKDETSEKQEGEAEGESEPPEQNIKKLFDFTVNLTKPQVQGRTNILRLFCALANDYRVYIESVSVDDTQRKLFLEDVSEELRERMYDYFANFGIDDKLGTFILDYREEFKIKAATHVLQHVHGFLEKSAKTK